MTATLTTAAVHTQEAGNPDAPLLLCLHGIGSSSAAFAPQLAGLSDQVRVVAWDAPGYAASADPGRAPGLDGYADTAAALIRDAAAAPMSSASPGAASSPCALPPATPTSSSP